MEVGDNHNRLFLTNWWCRYYSRPLKDPILEKYTIEELAYEYYLVGEVARYKEELVNAESDRIEEVKDQADSNWADEMEAEEIAEEEAILAKKALKKAEKEAEEAKEAYDPLKDPEQVKWMEEEIAKNKLAFGDEFGEDVSLNFEDEDE